MAAGLAPEWRLELAPAKQLQHCSAKVIEAVRSKAAALYPELTREGGPRLEVVKQLLPLFSSSPTHASDVLLASFNGYRAADGAARGDLRLLTVAVRNPSLSLEVLHYLLELTKGDNRCWQLLLDDRLADKATEAGCSFDVISTLLLHAAIAPSEFSLRSLRDWWLASLAEACFTALVSRTEIAAASEEGLQLSADSRPDTLQLVELFSAHYLACRDDRGSLLHRAMEDGIMKAQQEVVATLLLLSVPSAAKAAFLSSGTVAVLCGARQRISLPLE